MVVRNLVPCMHQIMSALRESGGVAGAEMRVLVDSVVGFQALIDTGVIGLLKVGGVHRYVGRGGV